MYSTVGKLWDYGVTRGLTNVDKDGKSWDAKFVPYKFADDAPLSARPKSQTMHLEFWQSAGSDYFVDWVYDSAANVYKRSNGGKPHLDKDTGKQIAAKNVDDGYENNVHLLYQDKGTGKAVIFKDGKRINGTWEKDSRTARTIVSDASGNELKFDRGLIWFEILPTDGVLTVK